MQLLIVVAVLLGVVALVAVWRRWGGSRAEEHAIERHEHALGVLGDVARHSDQSASVRVVHPGDVAKAHIRPTEDGAALVPRPSGEDIPPPRLRLERPVLPGTPPSAPLAFGTPAYGMPALPRTDVPEPRTEEPAPAPSRAAAAPAPSRAAAAPDDLAGNEPVAAAAPPAPTHDDLGDAAEPPPRPAGARRRPVRPPQDSEHERRVRRGATVGLAAVAAAAVAVVSLELAGGSRPLAGAPTTTAPHHQTLTTVAGGTGGGATTSTVTTTTETPSSIAPQSSSATDVSYRAPATSYTVTFTASGPCWIGIQQTAGGPWVWEETVTAGAQQTYDANGPIVVRLGAPPLVKVAIDGINVELPPSNVQPYDLTFTPSA